MILLAEHDESLLAAKKKRQHGASSWPTSTPKNRVWDFENTSSGRPSVEPQSIQENATDFAPYSYENASGRAEWLSRDPIGIAGGINLYGYVLNDPLRFVDRFGLDPGGSYGANNMTNPAPPPGITDTSSSGSSGGSGTGTGAGAAAAGMGSGWDDAAEDQYQEINAAQRAARKAGRPDNIYDTADSKCKADHSLKPYNFNDPAAGEGAAGDAAADAAADTTGDAVLDALIDAFFLSL